MTRDPNNIATWPLQDQAKRLWEVEGGYCVSSLVHTLAQGLGTDEAGTPLADLVYQAFELSTPMEDWESAARDAGWEPDPESPDSIIIKDDADRSCSGGDRWQAACELEDIEPHQIDVFEHWIVSDWLAEQLEAHGEKVDKDFAGLTVWARTTTGQAVYADYVIERIAAETYGREG